MKHFFQLVLLIAGASLSLVAHAEKGLAIDTASPATAYVFDTSSNAITATLPLGTTGTYCTVSPDDSTAYVSNGSSTVLSVNLATGSFGPSINPGQNAYHLSATTDGNYVIATNSAASDSALVTSFSTSTDSVVDSLTTQASHSVAGNIDFTDTCDDGTDVIGSGEYSAYGNNYEYLYRLQVTSAGKLYQTPAGGVAAIGGPVYCATGSKFALELGDPIGGGLYILTTVDMRILDGFSSAEAYEPVSAAFGVGSTMFFIANNGNGTGDLEGWSFNPKTGKPGSAAAWTRTASTVHYSPNVGVSQASGNVYYADGSSIYVLKPADGSPVATIATPTGASLGLGSLCLPK